MFDSRIEILDHGTVHRYEILDGARRPSYGEVLTLWRRDDGFRSFFISLLSDAPFTAYRWETPPVTVGTLDRPFEFVLLDSPGLEVPPDVSESVAALARGECCG